MKNTFNNSKVLVVLLVVLAFGVGYLVPWHAISMTGHMGDMTEVSMLEMGDHRISFLQHRDGMIDEMRESGEYQCCLENACTYCIEKTPGHGEGATCSCLEDVVNGRHPCGECIGEILEGHGNPYLSEYFASAVAEEVGMAYLPTMKQIISDKYGISISDQR